MKWSMSQDGKIRASIAVTHRIDAALLVDVLGYERWYGSIEEYRAVPKTEIERLARDWIRSSGDQNPEWRENDKTENEDTTAWAKAQVLAAFPFLKRELEKV